MGRGYRPRSGFLRRTAMWRGCRVLIARPRPWPGWAGVALVLAVGVAARRRPRRCFSWACASPPSPGSSPTTRPTRSSWAATCMLDLDNPYGHDYRESGLERFYTRDGSVSERVREREVALEHFAYFPGRGADRRGLARAARAARRLPPAGAAGHAGDAPCRAACSGVRWPRGSRWAPCWSATRSPCARPGSVRTTHPACCCWWWPSRWSPGGASAGRPPRWRVRSCSSSSRSWPCPSSC